MPFAPRAHFDWRLRTRTLALGPRTLLMAILNLTPDSFSGDGLGRAPTQAVLARALTLLDNGADILDLGAESTRPGATPLTAGDEQQRLLPILAAVRAARPDAVLSIDTYHASTAHEAAAAGADIINDVSGAAWDPGMPAAMAASACGLVLAHTRGLPADWRTQPPLDPHAILPLVLGGLRQSLAHAAAAGVPRERIVLDPGFGFGKRGVENLHLLAHLDALQTLGHPILAGLSRKHFLAAAVAGLQPDNLPPAEARLQATQAANTAAILAGAHILRVHDLQAARETAATADALLATTVPAAQPALPARA